MHNVPRDVFPPAVLDLITTLSRTFAPRRRALLDARTQRQQRLNDGTETLGFRSDTHALRAAAWSVAETPAQLQKRWVEITGPVDKKMVINALNSGADVFMADFEDATAPTWNNIIDGQRNLRDAVAGKLAFTDNKTGKSYALNATTAVLMVRPRGLHLDERHLTVDGAPASGTVCDLATYLFHSAQALLTQHKIPALYIPKLERMEEAALINDILLAIEDALFLPRGVVKVTVLIETLPAAFEMDEILFALRERVVGLNCGRWDFIFSCIKRRQHDASFVLPDRSQLTMDKGFLQAYSARLVEVCHRRGAHAMGGMSAFIPVKSDAAKNDAAMQKVHADKTREVNNGHDGTWVAHPGLVHIAHDIFAARLKHAPHQKHLHATSTPAEGAAARDALLQTPTGERTDAGLRSNIRVGVAYLAAWLGGQGCVPLDHLMEDAATAEISRTQIWQWRRHSVDVGGAPLTDARLQRTFDEECAALTGTHVAAAKAMFFGLCTESSLTEFLTLPAYDALQSPLPETR
jgi:malate synthase